ncbi:DUF3800 domain-containing protein [Massilia endophytica]|uniref:DUF3800 domain-containing protein n=1 Tax=Massilia endophytica TaxID=2899220 RepID=UPI001E37A43E|nr:DUF3800 domain-containing protein [Massilia endophytica]UGQ44950.1 DUF3800 domain-containing protein [Massilia endophytica]
MAPSDAGPFFFLGLLVLIYVDESGDLGWSFDQPYGKRGSSRYLTIAAMLIPDALDHLPARKVKHLYHAGRWDKTREKKWVDMPEASRETYAKSAVDLCAKHKEVAYRAIVVNKQRVAPNLRADSNKLYNYMLKLLLLDEMRRYRHVTLVPDPRSIKVENGNCLHSYLEMALYEIEADTTVEILNRDSKSCLNLQFVDMLAGVVGTHYEFKKSNHWETLKPFVRVKELFFAESTAALSAPPLQKHRA